MAAANPSVGARRAERPCLPLDVLVARPDVDACRLAGGLDHFGLYVGQKRLAVLGRRLKAAGVKVVGRRGRWSVYIKDPNGYTVELYAD